MLVVLLFLLVLVCRVPQRTHRIYVPHVWCCFPHLLHDNRASSCLHGSHRSDCIDPFQCTVLLCGYLVSSVDLSDITLRLIDCVATVSCNPSVRWVGGNGCTTSLRSLISSRVSLARVSSLRMHAIHRTDIFFSYWWHGN